MEHKYKLSICMMVKDEEKNIKRCLDSLVPLIGDGFGELIIIDTGSKDKTIEIAKQYTSNIYYHKWNSDFSYMRNKSIYYANGEWIFIIDADERLDSPEELRNLIKNDKLDKFNSASFNVKSLSSMDEEKEYSYIVSPRIFRNDGYFRYKGVIHNQPIFKSPTLNLNMSITHWGYMTSDKQLMDKKFNRTSTALLSELKKDPENLYYGYQLGASYDIHGDKKEALNQLRKVYSVLNTKSDQEKKKHIYIYGAYAIVARTSSKFKEALDVCKEGIDLRYDYVDLYYIAALCEDSMGNEEEAIKYYLKYIELSNKYNELEISRDLTIIQYNMDRVSKSNAYFYISQYYLNKDKYNEAYKTCKLVDDKSKKTYLMIKILIKLKNYEELIDYYNNIDDKKMKDFFLTNIEDEIKSINNDEKNELYKKFSTLDDIYGLYNNIRISEGQDKVCLTNKFLRQADFNNLPLFYTDVFFNLKSNVKAIVTYFKNIETLKIRNIVEYLIENDEEFIGIFEDYLLNELVRPNDINGNKVYISIAAVMLINNIDNTNRVDKDYYNIFKLYIDRGINFVSQIYNFEKVRIIYKSVNNCEDRFFMLMYIVNDYINRGSAKNSIKYFREALDVYEPMVKYIDAYKDEVYNCELTDK